MSKKFKIMSSIRINCPNQDCDFLGSMETMHVKKDEVVNITAYDCFVEKESRITIESSELMNNSNKLPVIIMNKVRMKGNSKLLLRLPEFTGIECIVLENVVLTDGKLYVRTYTSHAGRTIRITNVDIYESGIEVVSYTGCVFLNEIKIWGHHRLTFNAKIAAVDNIIIDNLCLGHGSKLNIDPKHSTYGIRDLKLINVNIERGSELSVDVVADEFFSIDKSNYSDLFIENYCLGEENWIRELEFNSSTGKLISK